MGVMAAAGGGLMLPQGGFANTVGCDWKKWAERRISQKNSLGLPVPSKSHQVWQECELGMFFHFDIPIYKQGWNWRSFKDMPDPNLFNPVKLDTDQWMEAAKAMGAKYAVLVAKHCSGFLTWQSDAYDYGVRQSKWRNGKGDLVADFIASCEKYGMKPGIYASVTANGYMGVDNPGLVNHGKGGDAEKQKAYAVACETMCRELWGRYGRLFEIWFDGGALPPQKGGPDLMPLLAKYQPDAMVFQGPGATIRWIGNERGVAGYPNWSTVSNDGQAGGDPNGKLWRPGECDVPVRNHDWFWKPNRDNSLYSVEHLMDMYYRSVGRNANLLLNANPNPDGLVPAADMKRYEEFGREIRKRFSKRLAGTSGEGVLHEMALDAEKSVDHIVIQEDLKQGERIRRYVIEARLGDGSWGVIAKGESVGHKRIEAFSGIVTDRLRLRVTESTASPVIRAFEAYYAGKTAGSVSAPYYNNLKGWSSRVEHCSSEHPGCEGLRCIDGRKDTFWHSEWVAGKDGLPQEIVIRIERPQTFKGFRYLRRQDAARDGVKAYTFSVGSDGRHWKKVKQGTLPDKGGFLDIPFDKVTAQYIRFTVHSTHGGKPFATCAELDVIR